MKTVVVATFIGVLATGILSDASGARRAPGARQAARSPGEAALLPADAAVPGWKKVDHPRVFTQADLYGYIDGGAELFLEFGFDNLTLQKYRSGGSEVAVEVYRMADPGAAAGIYLMKCGRETPDPSLKERHTLNRHQLMFQRNRYYVTINNLSGGEKAGPDLLRFAGLVAGRLPADLPAPELKRLPAVGLVAGSPRLFRGPFALQSLFTLGEGDILQQGNRVTGVAGNYKDAGGAYTLLLVDYPDAAAAKKAFAHLQQNLDKYLKPTATGPARLVFKDYEAKFGAVSVAGRRLEIRLHLTKA